MNPCIGLFGTCGRSTWRDPFIARYERLAINYFNPNVPDWNEVFAEREAEHLATDDIILFPITSETYSLGSLAETGFSILQAVRLDDRRDFVLLIDQNLDDDLDNPDLRKESLRTRRLVMQHLMKLRLPNVYIVSTVGEMLDVSLTLWNIIMMRGTLIEFIPMYNYR